MKSSEELTGKCQSVRVSRDNINIDYIRTAITKVCYVDQLIARSLALDLPVMGDHTVLPATRRRRRSRHVICDFLGNYLS